MAEDPARTILKALDELRSASTEHVDALVEIIQAGPLPAPLLKRMGHTRTALMEKALAAIRVCVVALQDKDNESASLRKALSEITQQQRQTRARRIGF